LTDNQKIGTLPVKIHKLLSKIYKNKNKNTAKEKERENSILEVSNKHHDLTKENYWSLHVIAKDNLKKRFCMAEHFGQVHEETGYKAHPT